MTPPTISAALAAEHVRDLERAAARRSSVVITPRRRPAVWALVAARVRTAANGTREWFRHGQLGPTSNHCVTC
jgi:hypothetical protein